MPETRPKRPAGDIMCEMEDLLFELHGSLEEGGHDLQHGEVLGMINSWQKIHVPSQIETYTRGNVKHPVLYIYGPKPDARRKRDSKTKKR